MPYCFLFFTLYQYVSKYGTDLIMMDHFFGTGLLL